MTKIMVVDDEPDITFIVKETLTREGYDVIVANNGKEALEKIKSEDPDLVLLDVMMPELDGWETCKQIKADDDTKDTMVTMLTVKSEDEDKVKSLDYALADWHINKPIDRKKLVKTVKWLLTNPIKRA
ncbi:MAG TPA: response regulator transcription factor [Euryarchaeota archaeon]|nr:alkaline phosphatase synthesis transcriptional regulatory protein PhoP [archaeon BMS3Abin16]GBE55862.1 alkaline phosphatase synthesis transcriptional regulatory protein PhoP [archaeon BMS3Bbin16]HDH28047.1 response regulator transcription factor [Euryarchaeota archaeon]HDY73770.1 response regulator transcription factor [Euryarchaeota archaeon]